MLTTIKMVLDSQQMTKHKDRETDLSTVEIVEDGLVVIPDRGPRNKKDWLKQSPCRQGCLNLDSDEGIHYCEIVTNIGVFQDSYFGENFEGKRFHNCRHKVYSET